MDENMDTKGLIDDARPREETTMIQIGVILMWVKK